MARLIALLIAALAVAGWAQDPNYTFGDDFAGDWEGTATTAEGDSPLFAQVINWGNEGYQVNLLPAIDRRVDPYAVLRGKAEDGRLVLGEGVSIEDGVFKGAWEGGTFELERVVHLSPTLNEPPPEGATVLFDGTNLDAWILGGDRPWIVNLRNLYDTDNAVAYMRARVWSARAQEARLEAGSDDGLVVWLNGEIVNQNVVSRPLTPWEDKVDVELVEGWNDVLLKVIQGGGDWSGCARFVPLPGEELPELRFDPMPNLADGLTLLDAQENMPGAIVTWEVAGPYTIDDPTPDQLAETEFDPEDADAVGIDWTVVNDNPKPNPGWKIVDGAMEVTPGTGSMVTAEQWGSFHLHLEFRTPWEPDNRGQGRGNSGVYLQGRHEIQVLDSYGLSGEDNECGGFYGVGKPLVNACAPPLQWQTYDIDYHAPRCDADGARVPGHVTVVHNGLTIHDSLQVPEDPPATPGTVAQGPLLLQDHWNQVRYRNIWIVPE